MRSAKTQNGSDPWVRVIIVNYNAAPYLQACVDSLAAQTLRDFEAVIVDNASTDGSADSLRLPDQRFTLIRSPQNVGFAAANNLGAQGCDAPWIATLNPDTVAEPNWLEEMRAGVVRHPGIHMFGATLLSAADPGIVDGFGDALSIAGIAWRRGAGRPVASLPESDAEAFSPCAAAALYCRRSFEDAGRFDESFFCYLEDVDLGFRLRLAGARCLQLRRAIVQHHGSAITGAMSEFTLFHTFRNRLWLIFKNMPPLLLFVALPLNLLCSVLLILDLMRRHKRVKPCLKGLLDGLAWGPMWNSRRQIQRRRKASTLSVARLLAPNLYRFG